jgi:hypothetical protein
MWRSLMNPAKVFGALAVLFVAGMLAIQCNNGTNVEPDGGNPPCWPNCDQIAPGCDPDGRAPCPDAWFICTNDDYGGKRCEDQGSATPPGDGWVCEEEGGVITCRNEEGGLPDGEGWECDEYPDGSVVCRRHSYYPDTGGEEIWDCNYEGEFRICHSLGGEEGGGDGDADSDLTTDGGSECPPGIEIPTNEFCPGDGLDNDCDGRVDEDCYDEDTDCICNPGSWRYCDTPDYCLWGRQYCLDDQLVWGTCDEITDIPEVCAAVESWYSPRAEACCLENGFCCQDMWDLDHDGDTWESLGNCEDIVCVDPESGSGG